LVSFILLAGVVSLVVESPAGASVAGPVVMVVSSPAAPNAGDAAVRDRLGGLGYTVTLVDDDAVSASDADGAAFVLVSSTVDTSAVGSTFHDVPEPVWVAKPWLLNNMSMTGPVARDDNGVVSATSVAVLAADHPFAAGMTDSVRVTSARSSMSYGRPAPTATVVTGAAGEPSAFVYHPEARLVHGEEAAGCRLHVSIYRSAPTSFTASGWDLFDAATDYAAAGCTERWDQGAQYAILVSVDGVRPDVVDSLGPIELPNFHRFVTEGSVTSNARSMYHATRTLPNHTSMVTGLPIGGSSGHGVTFNEDNGGTVHDAAGRYVPSIFDVAHDNGLRTGLFAGKAKFDLLDRSWNGVNGAPDITGPRNGRDKIDVYRRSAGETMTASYVAHMRTSPFGLSLVHYATPDAAGHDHGWGSAEYRQALRDVDE
jgi:hypothetical protein